MSLKPLISLAAPLPGGMWRAFHDQSVEFITGIIASHERLRKLCKIDFKAEDRFIQSLEDSLKSLYFLAQFTNHLISRLKALDRLVKSDRRLESHPQNERDRTLKACLGWCFCLDKIMSMLLARHSSLPKLMITSAELVILPEISLGASLMKTKVDLSLLIQATNDTATRAEVNEAIDLEGRFDAILKELKEVLVKIDLARDEARCFCCNLGLTSQIE
ncbi:hypothetical protein N7490_003545 [Penicillium lividum]|nr:hypothetical protein N7490_003545 [Penicillium lividum]